MKLVTIKFRVPKGGSRKVNLFIRQTMDHVSDELLVFNSAPPYKFPLYNGDNAVGEVCIEEEPSTKEVRS